MRRRHLCLLAIGALAVPGTAVAAPGWSTVPTPNPGSIANPLYGVSAVSATSAWAVGSWYNTNLAAPRTLALRWNGSAWSTVTTPNAGNYYNELYSVDATATNDAWAVGYSNGSSGTNGAPTSTLAIRWNGSQWSRVTTPNPGVQTRELLGVDAVSATDAWAVGWYYESVYPTALAEALALHWNGSAWTQVATPTVGNYLNNLYDVSATSGADVWAVGTYADRGEARGARHPLALHYDGSTWASVPVPATTAILRSVQALSPTDAWAVGSKLGYSTPVAYHWNGSTWSEVPTPAIGATGNNLFYGVTASGPAQVWAIGYRSDPNGPQPLVERWNGQAWSVEQVPNLTFGGMLAGAAAVTGTVWAVGSRTDYVNGGYATRTLALRSSG